MGNEENKLSMQQLQQANFELTVRLSEIEANLERMEERKFLLKSEIKKVADYMATLTQEGTPAEAPTEPKPEPPKKQVSAPKVNPQLFGINPKAGS